MTTYSRLMITMVSFIIFIFVGQSEYWFQAIVVFMALFLFVWADEIEKAD